MHTNYFQSSIIISYRAKKMYKLFLTMSSKYSYILSAWAQMGYKVRKRDISIYLYNFFLIYTILLKLIDKDFLKCLIQICDLKFFFLELKKITKK